MLITGLQHSELHHQPLSVWGFCLLAFVLEQALLYALVKLEFWLFLPLPPKCWNYKCVPEYLASTLQFIVGITFSSLNPEHFLSLTNLS